MDALVRECVLELVNVFVSYVWEPIKIICGYRKAYSMNGMHRIELQTQREAIEFKANRK